MYKRGQTIRTIRTGNKFLVKTKKHGGMGWAYVSTRAKDRKLYVLKTPIKKIDSCSMIQFRWESLVWIILGKHRNIVQAHWFDQDIAYSPFLIMEYVTGNPGCGVSLQDWIDNRCRIGLKDTLSFAIQALTGLLYAKRVVNRELGIPFVHRDIKPGNLLVATDNTIKVTDFGLVKAFSEQDGIGGTYLYMPPEQWYGKEVEEKTDVYALGCLLYEMITGHPPFMGPKERVRKQHLYDRPGPLRSPAPGLKEIVMASLKKDPYERPGFLVLRNELLDIYCSLFHQAPLLRDEPEPLGAEEQNARGAGFDQLGRNEMALRCYDRAISLDPHDPRFYLNRANALMKLIKSKLGSASSTGGRAGTKNLGEIEKDYRQALSLSPQMIEAYMGLGNLFLLQGDKKSSLEYYLKALKIRPDEPLIHVALGNLYTWQSDYQKAEASLKEAIKTRKELAEAHLGLGNLYLCKKIYQEAERHYQLAIKLNPLYCEAHLNLARLYQLMGQRDKRDKKIEEAAYCIG